MRGREKQLRELENRHMVAEALAPESCGAEEARQFGSRRFGRCRDGDALRKE